MLRRWLPDSRGASAPRFFWVVEAWQSLLAIDTDRDKLLVMIADVEGVLGAEVFSEGGKVAFVAEVTDESRSFALCA